MKTNIEWKPLKELCIIKRGSSPRPIQNFVNKGNNPWLKITDIKSGRIDTIEQKINDEGASKGLKAKKGDIIYTNSATPGIAIELKLDVAFLNDGFLLFTDITEKIEKEFLVFYLNSIRDKILKKGAGSIFTNLNKEIVEAIMIPVIKAEEQIEIGKLLSTMDKLIEDKEELVSNNEKLRQATFETLTKSKKSWTKFKIKEIFTVTRGSVLSAKALPENGKYPVYSSQTKNDGIMGWHDEYLYENAITWTTDGANAGDVKYRDGKFYCTNVCGVLISTSGFANRFTSEVINSVSRNFVSYVGNPKLMNNVMAEINISLPDLDTQQNYAHLLSSMDKIIDLHKQELEQLKLKKRYYLNKIFD